MENKDFRSRLKNHKAEYNPQAWDQMTELLDALPVEETKQERKLWLFLLAIIGLSIALFLIFKSINSTKSNLLGQNTNEKIETTTSSDQTNNKVKTQNIDPDLNSERHLANQNKTQQLQSNSSKNLLANNKSNSIKNSTITAPPSLKASKANSNREFNGQPNGNQQTSTEGVNSSQSGFAASTLTDNSDIIQNKTIPNVQDNGSDLNIQNKENGTSRFATLARINQLPFANTAIEYDQTNAYLLHNDMISLPKLRNLYWFGSGGIGDINGSRGYYIGSGLHYDLDKILAFELDWAFIGVNDKNNTLPTRLLGSDIETTITLWLQLKIIETNYHRFSLDLGPAATYTNNQVKEIGSSTTRQFSHLGWNFGGGASYTYFINDANAIGIKGAFWLFDAGYFSLKYYKKI